MNVFRTTAGLLSAAVLLLSGCQHGRPERSAIVLDARTEWTGFTKAALLRGASLATVEIGTSAFLFEGEWTDALTPNYFHNVPFRYQGSFWIPDNNFFWPGSGSKLRLFCYAPYGVARISDQEAAGAPSLRFTVPADQASQVDLLVADTGTMDGYERQALTVNLSHTLCAVRFAIKAGSRSGLLKDLKIGGLYDSASRSLAWGSGWTSYSGNATYSLDGSFSYTRSDEGLDLFGTNEGILLLLPQTRGDVWIRALYQVQGEEDVKEIKASPIAVNWEPGRVYTYTMDVRETVTVSVSVAGLAEVGPDAVFDVGVFPFTPADPSGGDYTGGNGDFIVTGK